MKKLTLPSGATCVVSKLIQSDFIEVGDLVEAPVDGEQRVAAKVSKRQVRIGVQIATLALTNACGPLSFVQNGKTVKRRIVNKEPWDESLDTTKEIPIRELDQADAEMIINEVMAMSKLTGEAAAKAKPFSEESTGNSQPAPDGEAVRQTAV